MKPNRQNPLISNLFRNFPRTVSSVITLANFAALTAVHGADVFWDRGSSTNAWGTGGNWSSTSAANGTSGAVPGTGDVAVFNVTTLNTAQTIDPGANRTIAGMRFASSGTVLVQATTTNRVLTIGSSGLTKNGTGAVTIGNAATNGNGVSITLSANQTWANNAAGELIVHNAVTGAFNLDFAGSGVIRLGGFTEAGTTDLVSTYSGVTTVKSGATVIAQGSSAFGASSAGTVVESGGMINLGGTLAANALSITGEAFTVSGTGVGGAGAIISTATNTQQNAIRGSVTLAGNTSFGGTQRWDIRDGTLNGDGNTLTKVGSNSVFLSGAAKIGTALNQLVVQQGEFVMETGATATAANITNGIVVAPTTAVTGAFRSWTNYSNHTANVTLDSTFAGSTAVLTVDTGITTHSGTITATGADSRLNVVNNGVMSVDGVVAGTDPTAVLRKEGNGVLLLNNAANPISGAFNLNGGTLGGAGNLTNATLNIANGGNLSPGPIGGAGSFNVANAITSAGTNTAVFNLGTSSDLVNVGTLTQNGTTNVVVAPGPGYSAGTYKLYDYTTLDGTGGFGGFSVAANHIDATLVNNIGAGSIDLQVNSTAVPTWSGLSNNIWQVGSQTNPVLPNFVFAPAPGGQVEFLTNDAVLFDDSAIGTTNIVTNGTVAPSATRFDNSTKDYFITGAISGIGVITKDGSGTATLATTPTTLGGLDINAGTLQLGTDSSSVSYTVGNIDIAAGATLAVMAGNGAASPQSTLGTAPSVAGAAGGTMISGGGTILLNATVQDVHHNFLADRSSVTIAGDMTGFTGNLIVNDGNRLVTNTINSLGNATSITIADGASLYSTAAGLNYAGAITLSGKGWQEPTGYLGAIRLQGGTLSGPLTLTGDTRISAYNGSGTISGTISGPGASLELGLLAIGNGSAGTLSLTNPANTYSGDTSLLRINVNAATIADAGVASSLGAGSALRMESGSLVITGPGAMTTNRPITLNQLGQGGGNLGVADPSAVVTYTGAITNGNANFPISWLDFQQTVSPAGTSGGTVVLDTTTPIRVASSTVHRQNLTLAGNTSFTVDYASTGTAPAPLTSPGAFTVSNNTSAANGGPTVLTIQDSAVLTTYGEFDIGNQNSGVMQTTTVNQTGGTVNAMRGGMTQNVINRAMRIGHWANNNATYNLSGGTLNAPFGTVGVGYDGTGTLNQTGGTANVAGLRFANSAATGVGTYNLSGGTLNVGALGMARAAGSATVNFDGGTYRATADHAISSNIVLNLNAGGAIIDTNGFNVTSASALLVGAGGGLTKLGAGEFVLPAGASNYTGATQLNGGALTLGAAGTVINSSMISVNNGGTLAGIGSVTSVGGVIVFGGGNLSPGLKAGLGNGTLTVSAATLTDGSFVNITPAASGGDLLAVTNGLAGIPTFNVLPVGATPLGAATYTLATAGSTTGLIASLGAYPHLADGSAPVLSVEMNSVTFTTSAAADSMIWSGAAGSAWDTSTVNQWNGLSGFNNGAAYFDGDLVTFNGASTVGSVTVQAAGVRPANVMIDSSATAYTLTGGGISGGGALTHVGGTTVLANNNSYLGTTTIIAGTLQIGNGGTTGTLGQGATTNDGTLSFNRSNASTYAGAINGAGVVRSDGTGTTTLSGASGYTGGTVISKGTLVGQMATSFGTGTITLNDASTGSSDTGLMVEAVTSDTAVTVANAITVANFGTGTVRIGSSERSLVAAGTLFTGPVSLGRDVTMVGEWDRTTFSNTISGTADTITIARGASLDAGLVGRVTWEGANTFTGATATVPTIQILDGAALEVGSATAKDQIPDNATVNVQAGGTFQVATAGDSETIGNLTGAGTVRNRVNTALNITFGTADDTVFSGVMNGGNSLTFIKQGTGTATWSGNLDNPTGNITVNQGTIVLAKDSTPFVHALGANSSVQSGATMKLAGSYTDTRPLSDGRNAANTAPLNFSANYVDQVYNNANLTIDGVLDMNNRSEAINGLIGTTGVVTNSTGGTTTLYVGRNNATSSYTGVLEDGVGVLNFVKTGTGTQTLGGNNTYTGTTTIYGGGKITMTHVNALGSTVGGTVLQCTEDGQYGSLNITLGASTPEAPNVVAESFTMYSETEGDQRTEIVNTAESTRLTGSITLHGDGISQINAAQTAASLDRVYVDGAINGTANGTFFLRGVGEIQVNGVFDAPNLQVAKTDTGLLILNSTGNNYGEASFVHGTVRTDVANALDPTAVLRMGQAGNDNTLDLNGNSQTVAALKTNLGVTSVHARTITSVNPATLTIDTPTADGGDFNYSGNLTGALKLVKTGPGAQVLSTPTSGVNSYTGDTVIEEGVLRLNASNLIPDGPTAGNMTLTGGVGTGVFDLNGNSETVNGLHGASGSTVTSNGAGTATLTVGGTDTPATSATFAGTIRDNTDGGSGVLNFTKLTASTQILSGTNTYTGATTVSAGTLLVNGALANTSSVTVASGATLGGSGSINSNVTINGNLAPGTSPGTLAITGTLDLPSTASLNWEINNLDQTVGLSINDLVVITGNLLLDGTLNVSSAGSFAGMTSGTWRLFDYTGTLTDNELTLGTMPALDAGIDWKVDVSTPNQVNLKIIPEASTALLLGLGTLGLALRRRRA